MSNGTPRIFARRICVGIAAARQKWEVHPFILDFADSPERANLMQDAPQVDPAVFHSRMLDSIPYITVMRSHGSVPFLAVTPEHTNMQQTQDQGLAALPEKQRTRIYAHYFLGVSGATIAKADGVSARNVRLSILPERSTLSVNPAVASRTP